MLKRKHQRWETEEIPMAPMIDMVFLLLIFFMCVSTLSRTGRLAKLELPVSENSRVPGDLSGRGIISIDREGRIHTSAGTVSPREMDRALRRALKQNPNLRVQIRADRRTPFGEIKKVLQVCSEAGAAEIIYATYAK